MEKPISLSKHQIIQSRAIVDDSMDRAIQSVSDVQMERQQAEAERRAREARIRNERDRNILEELEQSAKINRDIEAKWSVVAQKTIPKELYMEIGKQYQQSSGLIAAKEQLIKALQAELKQKDEDYVKQLSQHQEDVVEIVRRMQMQFHNHIQTCEEQLKDIEQQFNVERTGLIETNMAEIRALFEKRTEMEIKILADAQAREHAFQQELALMRAADAENYNAIKVTLENNIQLLEQQLEQMRATYQLNTEKLEYNHSVLEERDAENRMKMDVHQQRAVLFRTSLAAAIAKFNREDAKYKAINQQLTAEFHRVTDQFKELQKKVRHFEQIDLAKYNEICDLNTEQVMILVRKVLTADRLLHEQVLNLPWECPFRQAGTGAVITDLEKLTAADIYHTVTDADRAVVKDYTRQVLTGNTGASAGGVTSTSTTSGPGLDATVRSGSNSSTTTSSSSSSTSNAASAPEPKNAAGALANAVAGTAASVAAATGTGKFYASQMKTVLRMIATEGSFLLDARSKARLRTLPEEEQLLYQVDTVLGVLGVDDSEDLEELVGRFISPEGTIIKELNDVVGILKSYLDKSQHAAHTSIDLSSGKSAKAASAAAAASDAHTEKRARKKDRERKFWRKLGDALEPGRFRVWEALAIGLRKYTTVLEDRSRLIEETTALARQNEELKILLQEYLGSKINAELHVPPTRLIRVDNPKR